jgi:hypothetical protein
MGTKPLMYFIYIAPKMSLEKTIETYNKNINLRIRYIILHSQTGVTPGKMYICIDNQAAIDTLWDNKLNSEPARHAIKQANILKAQGWNILTIWTPAQQGIPGNELADKLAKMGTEPTNTLCEHMSTTRTWMYMYAYKLLTVGWSRDHGVTRSLQSFPSYLWDLRFSDLRQKMTSNTKGTIGIREFVLLGGNIKPVMEFLKAMGIGFARNPRGYRNGEQTEEVENGKDGGMEGIAFGAFEE